MNEIICSRLCYLISNPEEALIRLRYIAENTKEYVSLISAYKSLVANLGKILEATDMPLGLEAKLNANDAYIKSLSTAIERDFNKNAGSKNAPVSPTS